VIKEALELKDQLNSGCLQEARRARSGCLSFQQATSNQLFPAVHLRLAACGLQLFSRSSLLVARSFLGLFARS
jgi:hypothetical protein